jgi:parallel beta-helix repeat protein
MKRQKLASMFFAVAMLTLASSARAVDGTIEINQAKVMAATGFPYFITATACNGNPCGSYRLTGNLTVPASKNGIDVGLPNVTIDLNGFSITGPGSTSATPIGIDAAGQGGVTVENGTVTGFGTGVQVGILGIVRNVHADANITGINGGNNTVVEGCTANNASGEATNSAGIFCSASCAISGNTVNGNLNFGILCNANGCVISGNTANSNDVGIECNGSGCLISGNTILNNGGDGIIADSTTGYGGNVLNGNTPNVSGGISMGNNVIGGVLK